MALPPGLSEQRGYQSFRPSSCGRSCVTGVHLEQHGAALVVGVTAREPRAME